VKKILVLALIMGLLITASAFAEEQGDSNAKVNLAARYYPAIFHSSNAPDYNLNMLFLEGNLFLGKDKKWKISAEYFGGEDTKNNIKLTTNSFTGRVGYDLVSHLWVTLDYKSTELKVVGVKNTYSGLGLGLEKEFKAGERVPIFAAVHYYPTLDGSRGEDFHCFEYEVQVKYQIPNAIDLSVGYKGENWNGFNNASNIDAGFNGPYFGVSKEF